jgi:hypothetical protein
MVMRKGTVFRASKLAYAEIGSAHEAARPLAALGLIEEDPLLDLDQLFDLLQKPEIGKIFHLAPHVRHLRKAEQLEALREQYDGQHRFSGWYRGLGRPRLPQPDAGPVRPAAPHLLRQLPPDLDRVRAVRPGHLPV